MQEVVSFFSSIYWYKSTYLFIYIGEKKKGLHRWNIIAFIMPKIVSVFSLQNATDLHTFFFASFLQWNRCVWALSRSEQLSEYLVVVSADCLKND